MLSSKILKKIKAGAIHLSLSVFVCLCVLGLIKFIWYPGIYFDAVGVGSILLLLILVDVSIGPLITFIVYDQSKKSLKFDLAVVALLQIAALIYGVNTVFSGRPVYLVFNVNIFTLVTANDISESEFNAAKLEHLPLLGPEIVAAKLPTDSEERKKILFSSLNGGSDLAQMPRYYQTYQSLSDEVKSRMLPLVELFNKQPQTVVEKTKKLIEFSLKNAGISEDQAAYVPVRGKVLDMTVLVKKSDAKIIDILPINPW